MPWCLTHRITSVPPSVSVALKIALTSLLRSPWHYNNTRLLKLKHINLLISPWCASDFIMPWCLIHRITGVPPSVSFALKIALGSLDHHGITITLAYSS